MVATRVLVGSGVAAGGGDVGLGAVVAVNTTGAAVAAAVAVGFNAASMVTFATTVWADSVRILGISTVGSVTTVGVLQPARISTSTRKSEAKRS